MASGGMFHRGHSQLQLKLRRSSLTFKLPCVIGPLTFNSSRPCSSLPKTLVAKSHYSSTLAFSFVQRRNFLSPRAGPVPK